jgi:hypothetical protein
MAASAISPLSSSGGNATYLSPAKSLYQPDKSTQVIAPKPYKVTLTSAALAKSLESQGFPVSLISAKLGLDINTINQYLGITSTASTALFKTTYTPPKPTYSPPPAVYTAPKASYSEPQVLSQVRASLASDLTQLPSVPFAASQLIDSATKKASL